METLQGGANAVLGGVVPAGYLGLLLAASLTSRDKLLGVNQEKDFCGFYLDCHLSLSVVNVAKTKTLSDPPRQRAANGVFYLVTVKFRNNARPRTEAERAFTLKPEDSLLHQRTMFRLDE